MTILRSKFGNVHIPDNISLYELSTRKFQAVADQPAVIDGITGLSYTYGQLHTLIKRCASALIKKGLKKGDIVTIVSPNCIDWPVVYFAILAVGGIVSSCNPLYNETEMEYQLRDAGVKYLIASESCVKTVNKITYKLKEKFVFGKAVGYTSYSELISDRGDKFPKYVNIEPKKDICLLLYSSGTTGHPKGVMLSHYNIISNLMQRYECQTKYIPYCCTMAVLPFYHIYGMVSIMNCAMLAGWKLIILSHFEITSFLRAIEQYRVTRLAIVPPLAIALLKSPLVEKFNLSSLQTVTCGAAPLSAEVMKLVIKKLKLAKFTQGYGMTETSPATVISYHNDEYMIGSVGKVMPNIECKIIEPDTGKILSANTPGEICVRGPQIMVGYLNRPKETAAIIDKDGFLHTGDIGYYDKQDNLFVVDRLKELIKYKGFQVAPAEIEAILKSHIEITDAAVVGIPHEEAGEVPRALVVLKNPESNLTTKQIQEFVASKVTFYKKLRGGVEIVSQIPKSAGGKILRRIIRDRYKKHKPKSNL